jgi:hypothetical protein
MLKLTEVIPWGRSFDEYRRMFALDDADASRLILGCGDGPASFNCEAAAAGWRVVSCDPLYRFSAEQISRRIDETFEPLLAQVRQHRELFVWREIAGPDDLACMRRAAMSRFLADFGSERRSSRYVAAALPRLPLADRAFGLALCSHLLFLYSQQFDEAFHIAAVRELCRVADEVRIFPLLTLAGEPSPHVDAVMRALAAAGRRCRVADVPYEFQRGGCRMLTVSRSSPSS